MITDRSPLAAGQILLAAALASLLASGWSPVRAGDGCELAAEVAVSAVQAKAFQACKTSKNKLVCAIAVAVSDAAGGTALKKGAADSCSFVVEKVGDLVKITVKADTKDAATVKAAKEELEGTKQVKVNRWKERAP
jgi:hypothetical protein